MTRFDDNNQTPQENNNCNNCDNLPNTAEYQESSTDSLQDTSTVAPAVGITSFPPLIAHIREEDTNKTSEKSSNKPPVPEPLIPELVTSLSVSSSDLNNVTNFPLKERNFLPKLRESTSFDPRESVIPRNLVINDSNNGKENKNSHTDVMNDNTIQCNEVSSSNIEIDSVCNEDEESESTSTKNERHNLRSTKKGRMSDMKEVVEEEKVKVRCFVFVSVFFCHIQNHTPINESFEKSSM